MPYSLLLLVGRKPGTTPAAFKDHFENKHIALIKSICGDTFPATHTRHYIHRDETSDSYPASMIRGADCPYDAVCVMSWPTEADCKAYMAKFADPEAWKKIEEDDVNFTDGSNMLMCVLGETAVTENPALK